MKSILLTITTLVLVFTIFISCTKTDVVSSNTIIDPIKQAFGNSIDLNNLANYANQTIPTYITKDNGLANPISNIKATLGRVLFYDKNLSVNNSISCGSCHKQ